MAFILPALAVAGPLVGAIGTIQAGEAKAHAATYSAQVARNNQIIVENSAKHAEQVGMVQAQTTSLKGASAGGRLKASQAASGVDASTGSNVDVQEGQRTAAALDTETVFHNAELAAYGYRTQAANFANEAKLKDFESDQAVIGAALGAGGGLLGSANAVGLKWGAGPSKGGGETLTDAQQGEG